MEPFFVFSLDGTVVNVATGQILAAFTRVFSPIRERVDNLSLMKKKHCFFTVFMKLQNNDIITFLKNLQDYMEHLLRYLFTKIINKTSTFITFSTVLIGSFIVSGTQLT